MKRNLLGVLVGILVASAFAFFFATGTASADQPFNPDCHLEGINASLDSAIAQIKSSPAAGSAGGHYGSAVVDLQKVKVQLHDGCFYWNSHR